MDLRWSRPTKLHPKVTRRRIVRAVQADDNLGFCVKCGEEAYGVEPDASRYVCEACGERGVYGAQELLFEVAL